MKVLFLDVDGVLNSKLWCEYNDELIDSGKVSLLKTIIDNTNAKIVLSSTWRELDCDIKECKEMYQYLVDSLAEKGLQIYDKTYLKGCNRPKEIKDWLSKNNASNFVSLDDDFNLKNYEEYGIGNHLVSTSFWGKNGGLQDSHVKEAIRILNNSSI